MKNNLFTISKLAMIAMLAILAVTVSSCGDDDDDSASNGKNELVGLWSEDPTFTSDEFTILDFKKDGTIVMTVYFDWKVDNKIILNWRESKGNLTMAFGGMTRTCNYTISGDVLIIKSFSDDGDDMILYRIEKYPSTR